MYNSIIVENLMNPKIQAFRIESATIQLLNQAYPYRKGLLERINQRIQEIREKSPNHRLVAKTKIR